MGDQRNLMHNYKQRVRLEREILQIDAESAEYIKVHPQIEFEIRDQAEKLKEVARNEYWLRLRPYPLDNTDGN